MYKYHIFDIESAFEQSERQIPGMIFAFYFTYDYCFGYKLLDILLNTKVRPASNIYKKNFKKICINQVTLKKLPKYFFAKMPSSFEKFHNILHHDQQNERMS